MQQRISYVIGNLKMNLLSREEARQYLSVWKREMGGRRFERTVCAVCPSFAHLSEFDHLPNGIKKGAQDTFWEKSGAYTGEVSPATLRDENVEYVIVGHSERRLYGGETNETVREKAAAVLKHHMVPVVCIGETEEERRADDTDRILSLQTKTVFTGLSKLQAEGIIIAYEPRWAIGTDRLPTTGEILSVRVLLRKILTEMFGAETAERVAIIYGGSVKSASLGSVSWEAGMDGVLVGRESLFPYELVKMASMLEEHGRGEE